MTWQYIAGFFDGEGSVSGVDGRYRISIPQTNKKVLCRIRKFSKVGTIITPTKREEHWKDAWVYTIHKQENVAMFLEKMLPYLIVKEVRARLALRSSREVVRRIKIRKKRQVARISKIRHLRAIGLNYRQIGRILNMDWGYARRLEKFY